MTIAGLYVSPEGIVLGADSTSSYKQPSDGFHFYNHAQKLFEVGEDSTYAILTWGLGGAGDISYRALIARLGDELKARPATSVDKVAEQWVDIFWPIFSGIPDVRLAQTLNTKGPHDPADAAKVENRTADEEKQLLLLRETYAVGFCIAGYAPPSREPEAVTTTFEACAGRPVPKPATRYAMNWWGMQNVMNRVIYGVDDQSVIRLMASGKWTGTLQELVQVLVDQPNVPGAHLPIRDAIDYVHSGLYCTIKSMKFSKLPQVCGGPIEIAVITADRKFRWVRHKTWDAAILEGEHL